MWASSTAMHEMTPPFCSLLSSAHPEAVLIRASGCAYIIPMHENLPVALSSSGSVTTGLGFESSTSFEEFSLSSATIVFPVLQVKSSQQAGMPSLFKELVDLIDHDTVQYGVKIRHTDFSSPYFFFNANGAA